MSQISLKSISGITSITTPAGVDNVFTVHTNDTTEKFRIDQTGNQNISGIVTATNFKTGSSNLHSAGVEVAGVNVLGADTPIGAGSTIYNSGAAVFTGVVTATQFKGDGSQLTGVVQSDTPLGNNTASTTFYESDSETTISTDTTLSRASSNTGIIYTKFQQVVVAATKSLIVDAGESLVVDAYKLSS